MKKLILLSIILIVGCEENSTEPEVECVVDCVTNECTTSPENVELWNVCYNIEETDSLDLNWIWLRGEIPPDIGNLTNLEYLDLSDTQLGCKTVATTGSSIGGGWECLEYCDGSNGCNREIPSEIVNLTNLTHLDLGNNELTGKIPSEIGNLTNLTYLSFHNNSLWGEIPYTIENLTNLTKLKLFFNELTGEIPSEIGNLTNLNSLSLSSNQLSGEIPPEIGNLTNLTSLSLSNNQLTGEIPPEIGNLTNLEDLFLGSNQLTGEIPEQICNCTHLYYLNLFINQLCPPYPDCLSEDDIGTQDTSECEYCIENPTDPLCN